MIFNYNQADCVNFLPYFNYAYSQYLVWNSRCLIFWLRLSAITCKQMSMNRELIKRAKHDQSAAAPSQKHPKQV